MVGIKDLPSPDCRSLSGLAFGPVSDQSPRKRSLLIGGCLFPLSQETPSAIRQVLLPSSPCINTKD